MGCIVEECPRHAPNPPFQGARTLSAVRVHRVGRAVEQAREFGRVARGGGAARAARELELVERLRRRAARGGAVAARAGAVGAVAVVEAERPAERHC